MRQRRPRAAKKKKKQNRKLVIHCFVPLKVNCTYYLTMNKVKIYSIKIFLCVKIYSIVSIEASFTCNEWLWSQTSWFGILAPPFIKLVTLARCLTFWFFFWLFIKCGWQLDPTQNVLVGSNAILILCVKYLTQSLDHDK